MARVGLCRLSNEGVATVQRKYREGRWVNIAAFCANIGIARSTYYELIGRSIWFEQATIEDKLGAIGIPQADYERLCEFKDRESDASRQQTGPAEKACAGNLPVQLTSFIGREREVAQVKSLLGRTRLLTLVGTGGSGKTRLSLQVAGDLLAAYPDGVWQIELAPLTDPDLVVPTMVTTLGLREQPGQTLLQTLTDYLRAKTTLLLLDNCEHLMASCASLADNLLRACPTVTLLATSREALRIAGETVWHVPPLSQFAGEAPAGDEAPTLAALLASDAVRLFVERARTQRLDFALTRQNGPLIAEVCRRLDGIPLAIELAAARVRTLTMEQLAQRLDHCFQLLTGGLRQAAPRQQTLRALIDWSYDLLEAAEKILLARLSVFAGGWTLEEAVTVCAGESIADWEVLDLLTSLADKSLVAYVERSGVARFRLLETIRQYALERLAATAEPDAWRLRHRDYFLLLAEEVRPRLRSAEQAHWFAILEAEHDNLRQAVVFCLENAAGGMAGLRLGWALQQFWQVRGYVSEGRERMNAVLAHSGGQKPTEERAGALNGAGQLARMQGDYAAARALHEESLTIQRELGDRQGIANSLNNLGVVANDVGDAAAAYSLHEESLAIRRELGDRQGIADSLNNLGLVTYERGDYAAARALLEESLANYRELGDKRGIALSLHIHGRMASDQEDDVMAEVRFAESLSLFCELGDRRHIAWSYLNLGRVAHHQGDDATARTRFAESLSLFKEVGDRRGTAWSLLNLGRMAGDQDDYVAAQARLEESLSLFKEVGDRRGIAWSLLNLGRVAGDQDDYALAQTRFAESLSLFTEVGDKQGIANALEESSVLVCRAR